MIDSQTQRSTKPGENQPPPETWPAFLAHLHRGGGWGYWWRLQGKVSDWWPTDNPGPLPGRENVYYGVHPATSAGGSDERAKIPSIAAVNCVFAEYDCKDYGDKARILAHVDALPVAPSVLIDSGGGLHSYWLFGAPFILATEADRERARRLQAAWVAYAGGDPNAKDLARVLRVPGTLNCKYDPPRPVAIVRADLARLYNLPDLETLCRPPEPKPATSPSSGNGNGRGPADNPGQHWLDWALGQARVGNRNRTGFDMACQLRDDGLSLAEAEDWALAYARQVPQDSHDYYSEDAALASLRSAYSSPARERAQAKGGAIPTRQQWEAARASATPAPADTEPPDWPDIDPVSMQPPPAAASDGQKKPPVPTDDELADRWIGAHPNTAWGLGEFRRYDGGIWPIVPLDVIRREIKDVLEGAKVDGIRPTARLLNSVLELARIEVAQPPEMWDANHDILVCANGALHIPTRTLQAHDKTHYATSRLPFDYDPAAVADTWAFVLNCCAPEAQDFLQEFAGYALTTDTRYETAVWLAGQPGGGKSTILEGLRAMLGARVCLLGLADIEKSRFALTHLPGKTLAISTEQPGGYVSVASVLNAIISGETITVDRKFRDPVAIVPRAKLAWALNELPRVGPEGAGLFRRVKVLNFPPIPEKERDPNIKERIKLEGAGILNWALDGLARLRARGRFDIPAVVQEATAHFRETNDIPAVFVAECCLTGTNPGTGLPYRTQGSALYKAYSDWCRDNGHKPASSTSIADDWRRLGFEKYLAAGKAWWRGVGVVDTRSQVSTGDDR